MKIKTTTDFLHGRVYQYLLTQPDYLADAVSVAKHLNCHILELMGSDPEVQESLRSKDITWGYKGPGSYYLQLIG